MLKLLLLKMQKMGLVENLYVFNYKKKLQKIARLARLVIKQFLR